MKRLAAISLAAAAAAAAGAAHTVTAQSPAVPERREIRYPGRPASDTRPFSDAVLVGRTLYLAGRTGHDVKTGTLPASVGDEVRAILDQMKAVLGEAGMTMDDLVFVQVYCTDVKHYAEFNDVYRTYFTKFPARAFLGSGPLLGNARFEIQGIAEKR